MKEYIVELEEFEKTEQRKDLDLLLIKSGRTPTDDISIFDNVESTYIKYMHKYGSENIKINTNKLKPQTYKCGMLEIDIINTYEKTNKKTV
jgi:hypothetical protein